MTEIDSCQPARFALLAPTLRDTPARFYVDDGIAGSRVPWTALGLLMTLVAAFVAEHIWPLAPETDPFVPSLLTLYGFGSLTPGAVLEHGQVLRLFSYMLLHVNLAHLLGNSAGLLLAGWSLERLVGRPWFLAIFTASALGGAIAAVAVYDDTATAAGASAGVMGLLGATLVFGFRLVPGRKRTVMNVLAAILMILTFFPGAHEPADRVVYFAHLAGMLVGIAIAFMLLLTWDKASIFPRFTRVGRVVGVAGVALAVLGIPVSLSSTRAIIDASRECNGTDPDAEIRGCSIELDGSPERHGNALMRRGSAYLANRDYDLAIADFDRLIVLAPNTDVAYLNRGFAYARKNLPDLAIQDFDSAIKLNPGLALAYLDRAAAYLHERKFNRVIADATEAIRLDPKLALAYGLRGETYGSTGAPDQGIADISHALELYASDPQLYYQRAVIYQGVGRLDEAIADNTEVIRRDPTYAAAYNNRAWALHLKGKDATGLADAEKAVALAPHYPAMLETRAEIYEKLGRKADAVADYRAVLEIDPGERLALDGLHRLRARVMR